MSSDKSGKKSLVTRIVTVVLALILAVLGYISFDDFVSILNGNPIATEIETVVTSNENGASIELIEDDGKSLIFTMIDVGQGDSFLLRCDGKVALVDCGTPSTGKDVVKYLQSQNIETIDYLFLTHPHDDHAGGASDVLKAFGKNIKKIIIPEVTLNTATWYISLMEEIAEGGYKVDLAQLNKTYKLGETTMKIIGPISEPKENLNNYSIVMKVSYGDMDILMTGDAEKDVESEIIKSGVDLDAEILKVGHHGSSTSTSDKFLKAVSPEYGFISAKVGNKFNHPTEETVDRLKKAEVILYRTDECGTVTATITKTSITFDKKPGDYISGPKLEEKNK